MQLTTTGFVVRDTLGNRKFLQSKPTYKVVKFITKEEFDKQSLGMMSKYLVKEAIKSLSGETIVIHYIKSVN